MAIILNLTWAAILIPLLAIGVGYLAETSRRAAQVGMAMTGFAFAIALVVLVFRLTHAIPAYSNTETFWDLSTTSASAADSHLFPSDFLLLWGIRVDPLSITFTASTLLLSLLVQMHALASQRADAALRRSSWAICLLTFGIVAAIISPNLFQFLIGWEIAGVAAWVLAAHRWERPLSAVLSSRLFVVLTVSDLALLLGMVMSYAKFGISIGNQPPPSGTTLTDPFSFAVLDAQWHLGHVGQVAGVGARTLVVLAVIFLVAAVIKAGIGPFHAWLTGAIEAPGSTLGLIALSAMVPAAFLVARLYPLYLEAPHLLTAVALVGAAGAVAGAIFALAQRDLLRIGVFAAASQAGIILATLGMGGFSPAMFMLFTAGCLLVLYFLVVANLRRRFGSHDVADHGGGWRLMPRTTLALAGWAAGISGLSLNTYSALSVTFRNAPPVGGGVAAVTQAVVLLAVLVTMLLTSLYAFRVLVLVGGGQPGRRRGFEVSRVREVEAPLRRATLTVMVAAAVATLAGIPGVSSFTVGSTHVPGLTFSHFIFFGTIRQQLAFNPGALLIAAVVGAGGALAARWLFSTNQEGAVHPLRARAAAAGAVLAGASLGERAAALAPVAAVRAAVVLDRVDGELFTAIPDAAAESVTTASAWLARLRSSRLPVSLATAFAIIAILLAASVLAVTGHFPVSIQ